MSRLTVEETARNLLEAAELNPDELLINYREINIVEDSRPNYTGQLMSHPFDETRFMYACEESERGWLCVEIVYADDIKYYYDDDFE